VTAGQAAREPAADVDLERHEHVVVRGDLDVVQEHAAHGIEPLEAQHTARPIHVGLEAQPLSKYPRDEKTSPLDPSTPIMSMMRWVVLAGLWVLACAPAPNVLHLGALAPPGRANAALFRQAVADGSGPAAPEDGVARAIGASSTALIGARLDRPGNEAIAWQLDIAVTTPPVLAPGLVVFGNGGQLVALSPENGQRLWALPARGAAVFAAATSEHHVALLLGDRRERWIAVHDRAARERLRVTGEAPLGAPALLATALLIPSGLGDVSAVDIARATELARVRVGPSPVQPLWLKGTLFFGGPPWVEAARESSAYALPRRPLPEPVWSGALDTALPKPGALPRDATRLYVDPTSARRAARDIYMATYGRVAIGLERDSGTLTWVIALPGRILAAAALAEGFALCDDGGSVRLIAAQTGRVERQWRLARERPLLRAEPSLTACALSSGRVLPGENRGPLRPEPLLDQLARVLGISDPALTEAQRFLSRELAARPEPEATRVLIELVTRRSLDRVLQSEAEDLLATRRVGQDHMLAALSENRSRGVEAPPIAPLGEALAALGERRAAPLLARQLNRPAHTTSALARAAAALEELASEAEYDELSVFFSLHRTSADDPDGVSAVVTIGRTLLRVGGQKARTLLQFATRDPLTVAGVKSAIERELEASAGPRTGS
jgi:hypothetical protein